MTQWFTKFLKRLKEKKFHKISFFLKWTFNFPFFSNTFFPVFIEFNSFQVIKANFSNKLFLFSLCFLSCKFFCEQKPAVWKIYVHCFFLQASNFVIKKTLHPIKTSARYPVWNALQWEREWSICIHCSVTLTTWNCVFVIDGMNPGPPLSVLNGHGRLLGEKISTNILRLSTIGLEVNGNSLSEKRMGKITEWMTKKVKSRLFREIHK